jgi:PTH1 family peptidyl-tRNA hydrolase
MKIVVGLGNPGRKYFGTRHNIGFDVLDALARRSATTGGRRVRFQAEVQEARMDGEQVLFVWPQTYMNLSGRSVGEAVEFYKLDYSRLLIVCDDFHLPVGTIRLRARGSAAGQKGLADVLQRLGTEEVGRLRIGVGPLPAGWAATAFVLGKFSEDEKPAVVATVGRAVEGITCWIRDGIDVAMNAYNG